MTVSKTCADCGQPVSRYPSGAVVHYATGTAACSTPRPGVPRKGQVVRYRPRPTGRYEYMRLASSAEVRDMESGPYLELWGYKCRRGGLPVNVNPSSRFLPAAGVEIVTGLVRGEGDHG